MKNYIKNYRTTLLLGSVCLFSFEVFSASEVTKRMIHDTLSKYCIPNDKTVCNTPYEGHYDPNYNFCLCEDDGMVYSKSQRKCVEVPAGTYYQKSMKTNIPKKCEPGTYQDKMGQKECKNCDGNACYEVGNNATTCSYKCGDYDICKNGSCIRCGLDTSNWEKIDFSSLNGKLDKGIYKIVVAGAVGGHAAYSTCYGGFHGYNWDAFGGNGEQKIYIIKLHFISNFKLKIGKKGLLYPPNIGGCAGGRVRMGSDGTRGGESVFSINGKDYKAEGGYGGTGSRATLFPCHWYGGCYNASRGKDAGNGQGSACKKELSEYEPFYDWVCPETGYVNIYKCY